MRIHNSLRNNFLGVLLLLVLVLPSVVGATYRSLYSPDETKEGQHIPNGSIYDGTVATLINELEKAKSPFDTNKITPDNVYRINTPNNSTYYYDPTPGDKTNNDDILIAAATNKVS